MPGDLSQGQRKLVGVARAIAMSPRLLCLDEPAAGLDTSESEELGRRLRGLADGGTSMLLIDHDMGLVLSICDRIFVLEFGKVIAAGPPAEVRRDPTRGRRLPGQRRRRGGGRMSAAVLEIEGLTAGYEDAAVVRELDLSVGEGEVVALLGTNGAGKTTTLRAVSGIVDPMAGSVAFGGRDLARTSISGQGAAGDRARPREPRALLRAHASPSTSGWATAASGSTPTRPIATSRRSPSCATAAAACSRAASSRCSPWRARWPAARSCCCWTSSASASRR